MAENNVTPELGNKLLEAQSAQEARDILAAAGQELTEEEAERLWQEVEHHRVDYARELSDDELDAVAGGSSLRDYKKDGCAATVNLKTSWCWSNDACAFFDVIYQMEDGSSKPTDLTRRRGK